MITGKPKARHAHRRIPSSRSIPLPPRRAAARLTGGPLAGLTVYIEPGTLAARTMRVPGHAGRYVHIDADAWSWETDHRQDQP